MSEPSTTEEQKPKKSALSLDDTQLLRFSKQVDRSIQEVVPPVDVFDSPFFDPVEYINQLFPNETALNEGLESFALKVKKKIRTVDEDILSSIRKQSTAGVQAKRDLEDAKSTIQSLFMKVKDIKQKAEQSEAMVQKITKDIKSLDYGKRNLTQTITALANLRVLVSAVDQLGILTQKRQYAEVANRLGAVNQLLTQFEQYKDIAKIKDINTKITEIRNNLSTQIINDFKSMERLEKLEHASSTPELLHDACMVVDQLDDNVRTKLIQQFVKQQIEFYRNWFRKGTKESKLDEIGKRYNWAKKKLKEYAEQYSSIFPEYWCVPQELIIEFCLATREDISEILKTSSFEATVLYKAILSTIKFERHMHERFHVDTDIETETRALSPNSPENNAEPKTENEVLRKQIRQMLRQKRHEREQSQIPVEEKVPTKRKHNYNFLGFISTCFEEHMGHYLTFEDKTMNETIAKILRRETWEPNSESNSSEDLFIYITESMNSCTAFSKGKILFKLADSVWKKYLRKYADALVVKLPKLQTPNAPKDVNFSLNAIRDMINQEKDKESTVPTLNLPRLTENEESTVCYIVNTADYCQINIDMIQDELRSVLEEPYVNQIDLSAETDKFYGVLKSAVDVLVTNLMNAIENELNNKMLKTNWAAFDDAGDQSEYVTAIFVILNESVPFISNKIPQVQFKFFCNNFMIVFWNVYLSYIHRCKRLSTMGAQQIRVDVTSLSNFLKNLLNIGDPGRFEEDEVAGFARKVVQKASRAENMLKVVLSTNDLLIDTYKKLIPDGNVQDLTKIMELKGLTKQEKLEAAERYIKEGGEGVIVPQQERVDTPTSTNTGILSLVKRFT